MRPTFLIIGAGPVGLLLANLLAARGERVTVVDKRRGPPVQSMAIGITPPSLGILRELGLDEAFRQHGVPVRVARVHEGRETIATLAFDDLPSAYRFILSLPQSVTIELFERKLREFPAATLRRGLEFRGLRQDADGVTVALREETAGADLELAAAYVVGCDGHRSAVRASVAAGVREHWYPQRYAMADFDDRTGLADEAHLFFSAEASVESFPLPGGQRRWIVLVTGPRTGDPAEDVVRGVRRVTGYDLAGCPPRSQTAFQTRRLVARRWHRGRVVLAGDAAHVMSPVGGQGMNIGFGDAALLAAILPAVRRAPARAAAELARYEAVRRRAFRVAAGRAARGMWLGTRRGRWFSAVRRLVIRDLLFSAWLRPKLAPYFAMLTIPCGTPR